MKLNRKLLASLLLVCLMLTNILPVSAARLDAVYQKADFYRIATSSYSRMVLFRNGVVPVQDGKIGLWGLMAADGSMAVPCRYEWLTSLGGGLFNFGDENYHSGIIDSAGNVLLPAGEYSIYTGYGDTICVSSWNSGAELYYNTDLKLVDPSYVYGEDTPAALKEYYMCWPLWGVDGLYEVYEQVSEDGDTIMGVSDAYGDLIIPLGKYDSIWEAADDVLEVSVSTGKGSWTYNYGIVDLQGNEVLPTIYSYIQKLSGGYLVAKAGGDADQYALLDDKGSAVVDFGIYTNMSYDWEKDWIEVRQDELMGVIGNDGSVVVPLGNYQRINEPSKDGYITANSYELEGGWGGWSYWDSAFQADGETNFSSDVYKDGQLVASYPGKMVISEVYWRSLYFSDNGETGGLMTVDGAQVLAPEYTWVSQAGDGVIVVSKPDPADDGSNWYRSYLYGLVTEEGEELIPCVYPSLEHLGGGLFRVSDGDLCGMIRADGTTVLPMDYWDLTNCGNGLYECYDGVRYYLKNERGEDVVPSSAFRMEVYDGWYNLRYEAEAILSNGMCYDGYYADVVPVISYVDEEHPVTTYVDWYTGESVGSLPKLASTINGAGQFVYMDYATGKYGLGQLTDLYRAPWLSSDIPSDMLEGSGTAAFTATASKYPISVDGTVVSFDAYVLKDENGNDTTFLKLRDVAYAINGTDAQFSVGWDGSILLGAGEPYEVTGTEMSTPFRGDRTYAPGSSTTYLKGENWNTRLDLTSIVLKDDAGNGYTYYKIRDLGQNLGFNVRWVQEEQIIKIETDRPYEG